MEYAFLLDVISLLLECIFPPYGGGEICCSVFEDERSYHRQLGLPQCSTCRRNAADIAL
jgi:hypothetical protein